MNRSVVNAVSVIGKMGGAEWHFPNDKKMGKAVTGLESESVTAHEVSNKNIREEDTELRENNVRGFVPGDIIQITEKFDGSNACCCWDSEEGCMKAFSRKQELNFSNNLNGFWNYVQGLSQEVVNYFTAFPEYRVFGEWSNKNKIVYNDTGKVKHWYVYDIFDTESGRWLSQDIVKKFCSEVGLEYIHELYYGAFVSWEHCKSFMNSSAYGDTQEGCFDSRTKILMFDGTEKLITQIKKGDIVKSYNTKTGVIENKKVLNVFNNGNKHIDKWLHIAVFPKGTASRGLISGQYKVTKNHKFWNGYSYSDIEHLDFVYHYGKVFDHFREQAFLGLMCSDGNYSKDLFSLSQKLENMVSFENLFRDFINPKKQIHISGKGSKIKTILFQKNLTTKYSYKYRIDSEKINRIKMFSDLDDIGWAYFFIGDGSNIHGAIDLCVASFNESDVNIIKKIFEKKYEVVLRVYKDKRVSNGHSGCSLRCTKKDSNKILKIWSQYIPDSYRYKLNGIKDIKECISYPQIEYGLTKRKIFSKKEISTLYYGKNHKGITAYDIEVEDNHNYFANGCLVHNCVIKNQTKLESVDDTKYPTYIKIVNDSFKERMKTKEKIIDPEKENAKAEAQRIMESIVTQNRIEKELFKMRDEGIIPEKIEPKDFGLIARHLPKRIFEDVMKEERELVMACGEFGGKACSSITMQIFRNMYAQN